MIVYNVYVYMYNKTKFFYKNVFYFIKQYTFYSILYEVNAMYATGVPAES